jgi:hypothetical protein
MNIASAPGFLSCQFETEILLSKNTFVFLHDQDPLRKPILHRNIEIMFLDEGHGRCAGDQTINDLTARSSEPFQDTPLFQPPADEIDVLPWSDAGTPRKFIIVESRPALKRFGRFPVDDAVNVQPRPLRVAPALLGLLC